MRDIETLRRWLQANPGIFAHHEESEAMEFADIATAKIRRVVWSDVDAIELGQNRASNESYVILLLRSGAQLVLCPQGFAFAPDFRNTGPLPLPTSVFCLRDYEAILAQLQHIDPDRKKEALELVMVLIALLDGASAVGLNVESEARAVDALLRRIEAI